MIRPLLIATRVLPRARLVPLIAPRARFNSTASSPQTSATTRADLTKRRFWKRVSIGTATADAGAQGELTVLLDGKPLRTPGGNVLVVPRHRPLAAALVAREWAEQERVLKSWTLPVTSLAARAIDGMSKEDDREKICDELINYLETDTICYQESEPKQLVRLQKEHWDPILTWARKRFDIELTPHTSLMGSSQAPDTIAKLRAHISAYDAWELAGFERAVMGTKSFLIALRLLEATRGPKEARELWGVEEASEASHVEVNSQIERWGEVEDTHDVDYVAVRAMLGFLKSALVEDEQGKVADVLLKAAAQT